MPVKISGFKGEKPIVTPRMLPLGYAQIARNTKLGSEAMESFRGLGSSVASVSSPATIYKFGASWLSWPTRRWVEKAAISGVERLLISSGAAYPKTRIADGTERRWGVIAPTEALVYTEYGTAGDDAATAATVSYVYTLVTTDGEESAPSPASAGVDIVAGKYASVSGWCVYAATIGSRLSTTGNEIEYIRVYRLASDAAGNAEYQRVSLRSTPTAAAVAQIEVSDITSAAMRWYDVNASQDGLSDDLGEVLQTDGWDPPPAAMQGACMFANGMYAGFAGNIVYLSAPGYYYAFPASGTIDYTMELPYAVVAMAAFNETLVVGTAGYPEVISGTDAAFMSRSPLPYQQPCLSAAGMVSTPFGVAYVSPDGLFVIGSSGGKVLTQNVIDRDAWNDLPLSTAILAYHNQKIFIIFAGSASGLIYDPELDYLVTISLPSVAYSVFADPVADILYIATASGIYAWEGSASGNLSAVWKSGVVETAPVNFPTARVEGAFPSGHTTSLGYYVDGELKHTQTVTDDAPFRLPAGFRGRDHEIVITFSKSTINAVYLAFNNGDLANV